MIDICTSVLSHCYILLYRCCITLQLHYISPNIGAQSGSAHSATSIFGYIGTPPQMRRAASPLVWKQGPCMLVEEAVSAATVERIYLLGPNYVGCLQAVPQGTIRSLPNAFA